MQTRNTRAESRTEPFRTGTNDRIADGGDARRRKAEHFFGDGVPERMSGIGGQTGSGRPDWLVGLLSGESRNYTEPGTLGRSVFHQITGGPLAGCGGANRWRTGAVG